MIAKAEGTVLVRWLARVLAAGVFLFWSMFFVEHLWEWFLKPLPQTPPVWVWFSQFLHLMILVGLVLGFWRERAGGIVVVVASVLFFWDKAPIYIPLTVAPGVLYLVSWWLERPGRRRLTIGD
jgi:hypothetical protein